MAEKDSIHQPFNALLHSRYSLKSGRINMERYARTIHGNSEEMNFVWITSSKTASVCFNFYWRMYRLEPNGVWRKANHINITCNLHADFLPHKKHGLSRIVINYKVHRNNHPSCSQRHQKRILFPHKIKTNTLTWCIATHPFILHNWRHVLFNIGLEV